MGSFEKPFVGVPISEVKTEIGSGGCDPTIEGLAYHMWSVAKGLSVQGAAYAREISVMPLLLLSKRTSICPF